MSIVRLIFCKFPADQAAKAERNWRENCAPLMIEQEGCLSEELLRCVDNPGEMISYSEWDSQEAVDAYLDSDAYGKIKKHNRNIKDAEVTVKHYELVDDSERD